MSARMSSMPSPMGDVMYPASTRTPTRPGRSYRSVAEGLRTHLPARYSCIESRGLRLPQRALFDYHANIETRRQEIHGTTRCPYLLVQTSTRERAADPGREWQRIWEGSRPRDRERYRLYRRKG